MTSSVNFPTGRTRRDRTVCSDLANEAPVGAGGFGWTRHEKEALLSPFCRPKAERRPSNVGSTWSLSSDCGAGQRKKPLQTSRQPAPDSSLSGSINRMASVLGGLDTLILRRALARTFLVS
jgi:hypothetical protein